MTKLDVESEAAPPEKIIPQIQQAEDEPLFPNQILRAGLSKDLDLIETDDIKKKITIFRFKTGRTVLYASMAAMGLAALTDIISSRFLGVESDLVTSAFEAFKLITMTVLGYFFASNDSNLN